VRKGVAIKSSEKLFVTSPMRWTVNVPQTLDLGETHGLESSTSWFHEDSKNRLLL